MIVESLLPASNASRLERQLFFRGYQVNMPYVAVVGLGDAKCDTGGQANISNLNDLPMGTVLIKQTNHIYDCTHNVVTSELVARLSVGFNDSSGVFELRPDEADDATVIEFLILPFFPSHRF